MKVCLLVISEITMLLMFPFRVKMWEPDDREYNYTHLILQYISVCGHGNVCDKTSLPIPTTEQAYSPTQVNRKCQPCSCDELCFYRSFDSCCPDLFFKFGIINCRNVDILSGTEVISYNLIDSCPMNTTHEHQKEITRERSTVEKLTLPPVTSKTSKVTYLDKHFAMCNGINETEQWSLDFACPIPTDMNYLSSYEEIIQTAKGSNCSAAFRTNLYDMPKCESTKNDPNIIQKCNVSGTWFNYDVSIEKACHSGYTMQYGVFKNVFCAMCNPVKLQDSEDEIISDCNKTGKWEIRDYNVEQDCRLYPNAYIIYPFKNIFCFMCNVDSQTFDHFLDFQLLNMNEYINKSDEFGFVYEPYIQFKAERLHENIIKQVKSSPSVYNYKRGSMFNLNLTNLMYHSVAFSGERACDPSLLPAFTHSLLKSCSCWLGCQICCDDVALTQPVACIDDAFPPIKTQRGKYRIIDGCLSINSSFYSTCTFPDSSDIYQALPVKDGLSFMNIYCNLCNMNYNINQGKFRLEQIVRRIQISNLRISCQSFIDYQFFLNFEQLFKYVSFMNCRIITKSVSDQSCELTRDPDISVCNVTGGWQIENKDIKFACEETEHFRFPVVGPFINDNNVTYKNKFCKICNPPLDTRYSNVIQECNTTGKMQRVSDQRQTACQFFPNTHSCSNYKNIFCQQCNEITYPLGCTDVRIFIDLKSERQNSIVVDYERRGITYRSIFSFSDYQRHTYRSDSSSECQFNQIYLESKNGCRNISCFPGKVMMNSSCIPLLRQTSNLRYTMAFKVKVFQLNNFSVLNIIQDVAKFVIDELSRLMETSLFYLEKSVFMADRSCHLTNATSMDIFIHLTVFVAHVVDRLTVEKNLLNIFNSSSYINFTNSNASHKILTEKSDMALLLPSFGNKLRHWCKISDLSKQNPAYKNVFVSPILICKQVIFESSEIEVNLANLQIRIIPFDKVLNFDQFELTSGGGARVCVDDIQFFLHMTSTKLEGNIQALSILTIICLVISLVCLLVTFITYCLFSRLRTIPGMNTMCLVFALFFAQIFMILQTQTANTKFGNIILSILTHYFWLCVFFCLQICSFYMFRVFTSEFKVDNKGHAKKKIMTHIIYSYGIPALIVGINITVSVSVSKGENCGYENEAALMNDKTAFIVSLICPLILVCVTNIFFFGFTAYKIKTSPEVQNQKNQKVDLLIYVKLFALTGLTWVLQIFDTFFPVSFLSYLVAILNGLQGLFLFLSYVCNTRVLQMYSKKLSKSKSTTLTSTKSGSTQATKL